MASVTGPDDGDSAKTCELPPIDQKAERLQHTLETLRQEHELEQESLRQLEKAMSESALFIQQVDQQTQTQRFEYELQMRRAAALEKQIKQARDELGHSATPLMQTRRIASAASTSSSTSKIPSMASTSRSQRSAVAQRQPSFPDWALPAREPQRCIGKRETDNDLSMDLPPEVLHDWYRTQIREALIIQALFRRAQAHIDRGENLEGEEDLKLLLQTDPKDVDAQDLLQNVRESTDALKKELAMRQEELHAAKELKERGEEPHEVDPRQWQQNVATVRALKSKLSVATKRTVTKKRTGAREAFSKLDLNGSGHISLQEFADGVERLGVNWRDITSFRRPRDLFALFDDSKDKDSVRGVLDFKKLFPMEASKEGAARRPTTPEFWMTWCRDNNEKEFKQRSPNWVPEAPGKHLEVLFKNAEVSIGAEEQRKWLSSSFRRLKNKGKSDAKARECIALHLPRGTGPKDLQGCRTLSEANVLDCKKKYTDEVFEPVKNVQKVVYEMRDTRRVLQGYKQQLYQVSMEPIVRQRQEEERKQAAQSMAGGLFSGLSVLKKGNEVNDGQEDGNGLGLSMSLGAASKSEENTASEHKLDQATTNSLWKEFSKVQDSNELLNKKRFVELLQMLGPGGRTYADSEVDTWWGIAKNVPHGEDASADQHAGARLEGKLRKNHVSFDQFVSWYADSEFRKECH